MNDTLGDRCKNYEKISEHYFIPKIPIIIRLDGKAFHTWTKGCKRPFDHDLMDAMLTSAVSTASTMQGCVGVYTQSDEITFVLVDDMAIETQQWFGGRQNKIESVSAATMTAIFNKNWLAKDHINAEHFNVWNYMDSNPAIFDARAFQVPKNDVANVLLWRVKDWERNSLTMFCQTFFSHKELEGQGRADRHEMLHKIGHNWATECSDREKNGAWWSPSKGYRYDLTNYEQINEYLFG